MLEDHSIESIVCWGPQRDCFIVKNIDEFSKTILPRIFNHSNFASFVRQLNKYDFHKVKQTTFNQGETTSTFRHPDFHGDKPDNLQNIKRKAAFTKASSGTSSGSLPSNKAHSNSSSSLPYASSSSNSQPLSSNSNSDQIYSHSNDLTSSSGSQANVETGAEQIREENKGLKTRIRDLEESHDTMQSELKEMGRDIVQQNGQMQVLLNLLGSMSVQSTSSIPVDLAQSFAQSLSMSTSISTSMSTSSFALGSTSITTGNLRPPELFTDQPQYHVPPMDAYPSNPGLQTQEPRSWLQHHQHTDRPQFPGENVNQPAVRFSENVDGEPIVDYGPTHSVSPTRSISVFGNLGQVGQATLLKTRELSRRTTAGLSPEAHHDAGIWTEMNIDKSGRPYSPSESFSDPFSSPSVGYQLLPSPETGKRCRDAEQPPQSVNLGTDMSRFRQQFEDSRFGPQTFHERNTTGRVNAGRVGQRGRRFSLGDEELQGRLFGSPSAWKGFDSPNVVNHEADNDIERGTWTGPRKRRGSNGSPFLHSGDRGGVDVEMLQLPLEVPIEISGGWSFDTTALATDGILHGLGIGGLSHTGTSDMLQSQNADTIAREFD